MVEAALIFSDLNTPFLVLTSIALFFVAAVAEIGGGYMVWKWLRERKGVLFGILGGTVLFIYGVIPTFQPAQFGRVYAYGGIFIITSILWGMFVDKEARSIRDIWICNCRNRRSYNILRPTIDAID